MDPRLVTPYLIAALVVWGIYRRMRRSFGRQRVHDGLMWLRIGILTAAAVLITAEVARDIPVLGALLAGMGCGAVLAHFAAKHTQFEVTAAGRFYTPHTYIGLAVTALFLGRLLYRFVGVYNGTLRAPHAGQSLAAAYRHSPFTLAAFGTLVGYYVLYYVAVLRRVRPPASSTQQPIPVGSSQAE
jgi:hypothetical protein